VRFASSFYQNIVFILKIFILIQLLLLAIVSPVESSAQYDSNDLQTLYQNCKLQPFLSFEVFRLAMTGYDKIPGLKNKNIITIIDFSKPSVQERFFVIDLDKKQVLYKTLVAHGKNSGENNADSFSNDPKSLKSCLGFFLTAETYSGKHGYSLKLDGVEPGINDNARKRSIVIHGADYVSKDFAAQYGRLGRSWGCPALPVDCSKEIIDKISNGSCLFIYANDPEYLKFSKRL
jgi:hypothetical protein